MATQYPKIRRARGAAASRTFAWHVRTAPLTTRRRPHRETPTATMEVLEAVRGPQGQGEPDAGRASRRSGSRGRHVRPTAVEAGQSPRSVRSRRHGDCDRPSGDWRHPRSRGSDIPAEDVGPQEVGHPGGRRRTAIWAIGRRERATGRPPPSRTDEQQQTAPHRALWRQKRRARVGDERGTETLRLTGHRSESRVDQRVG